MYLLTLGLCIASLIILYVLYMFYVNFLSEFFACITTNRLLLLSTFGQSYSRTVQRLRWWNLDLLCGEQSSIKMEYRTNSMMVYCLSSYHTTEGCNLYTTINPYRKCLTSAEVGCNAWRRARILSAVNIWSLWGQGFRPPGGALSLVLYAGGLWLQCGIDMTGYVT